MKVFLFVLCIFVLEASTTDNPILSDKLEAAIQKKCMDNAHDESAFQDFQDAVQHYYQCQSNSFGIDPPNPVEDHESFCTTLRNTGFYLCVENLMKVVGRCLDDTEKYLSDFVLHGINSTYVELCGVDGLANSKILYDMKQDDVCSKKHDEIWSEEECFRTLTLAKNIDNGVIDLNKNVVCSDLEALQKCFGDGVTRLCDPHYIEVVNLVFKPFTGECN